MRRRRLKSLSLNAFFREPISQACSYALSRPPPCGSSAIPPSRSGETPLHTATNRSRASRPSVGNPPTQVETFATARTHALTVLGTNISQRRRPDVPAFLFPVTSSMDAASYRPEPSNAIATMRRYHFDLVDTNTVTDATGAVLDDDNQARKIAYRLAEQVRGERPDLVGQGYEILVRTDEGDEVLRAAIDKGPRRGNS